MLTWKITIGKKPRGMWRPEIIIRFTNNENNLYNIRDRWTAPYFRTSAWGTVKLCCNVRQEILDAPIAPFLFFTESSAHSNKMYTHDCSSAGFSIGGWELAFFKGATMTYYPEWRPGIPDYIDYYEFLRDNFCLPAIAEYNRRIEEAMESIETEEIVYSSEMYQTQKLEKEVRQRPIRKLRTIAG